jgi:hypothetical protein
LDKPRKISTIEEARALPEVSRYIEHRVTDPKTGMTTVSGEVPKFYPSCTDGDQILLFTDTDGRSMEITYTENGPAKRVFEWP